jgi:hypothetical protein
MNRFRLGYVVLAGFCWLAPGAAEQAGAAEGAGPPGVVIDHVPASTGLYIGSPSLVVWTNGDYVASHDFFGPASTEQERGVTAVFRSGDRGASWRKMATVVGQYWSSLFVHRGALYLLGTDRNHGNVVIRRSSDGGETWTTPGDGGTGLLRGDGHYHCAPTPVIEQGGRLWRGMERGIDFARRGGVACAGMISVPVAADLLAATNWTFSNFIPHDRGWNGGDMAEWIEGNAVVGPGGQVVDVLRVGTARLPEKAAVVSVSPDGREAAFDPATGFIDFPGGAKKFTIRADPRGDGYWTLASIDEGTAATGRGPGDVRNTLALMRSADLRRWTAQAVVLHHPDAARHGFQYVDWQFEGEDLIAACRTAYDDGAGGAHSFHDANFLTFHRLPGFRAMRE